MLSLSPKQFIEKLDLSKLDENTAQEIRDFINSEDFKYIELSENLDEFKKVVEMIELHFPEALGLPSEASKLAESENIKKDILLKDEMAVTDEVAKNIDIQSQLEEEEKEAQEAEELSKKLALLNKINSPESVVDLKAKGDLQKKVADLTDRLELVKEMLAESPKKSSLKDRVELLTEMLEEAQDELNKLATVKKEEGGSFSGVINWREGNDIMGKKYYYSFIDGNILGTDYTNIKMVDGIPTFIDSDLVFIINKNHFIDQISKQKFQSEMKMLFPELEMSTIILSTYEDGGEIDSEDRLNDVTKHYLMAALWSTSNIDSEDEESLDQNYSISDIDEKTYLHLKSLVKKFLVENAKELAESDLSDEQIGHSLWLSQNGHGAGFFDYSLDKDIEDKLMKSARDLKSIDLYVSDDGKIQAMQVFEDGGTIPNKKRSSEKKKQSLINKNITIEFIESEIKKNNENYNTDFIITGSNGLYTLVDNISTKKISIGSKEDIYNDFIKKRYSKKYRRHSAGYHLPSSYNKTFTIKGNGKKQFNLFQIHTDSELKQAAEQLFPNLSPSDHAKKAEKYEKLYNQSKTQHYKNLEDYFIKEFGRKPDFATDYLVTGIWRDDFSTEAKESLNRTSRIMVDYYAAMKFHNANSKYEKGGDLEHSEILSDKELVIQPSFKYQNIAKRWLEDNNGNTKYKIAIALLSGINNPEEFLSITNNNSYDRMLRSLDSIVSSEHEMNWRTLNYSTIEAEKWATDSLREIFYVGEKKKLEDGGEMDSENTVSSFRYVNLIKTKNGIKVQLNDEGFDLVKELKEDDKSDDEIMYELFEDVQGNSEFTYIDNGGNYGFGLTEAPMILDGFFMSDSGDSYDTDYPESSHVYFYDQYMIKSIIDEMLLDDDKSVFFIESPSKYCKGGRVGQYSEMENYKSLKNAHASVYSGTFKDGGDLKGNIYRVYTAFKDHKPLFELDNLSKDAANAEFDKRIKMPDSEIVMMDYPVYDKYGNITNFPKVRTWTEKGGEISNNFLEDSVKPAIEKKKKKVNLNKLIGKWIIRTDIPKTSDKFERLYTNMDIVKSIETIKPDNIKVTLSPMPDSGYSRTISYTEEEIIRLLNGEKIIKNERFEQESEARDKDWAKKDKESKKRKKNGGSLDSPSKNETFKMPNNVELIELAKKFETDYGKKVKGYISKNEKAEAGEHAGEPIVYFIEWDDKFNKANIASGILHDNKTLVLTTEVSDEVFSYEIDAMKAAYEYSVKGVN